MGVALSVRVFLSAVSDEFRDYRDQLSHDLTRHNVEVKVQEDFKDHGGVTLDRIDLYIASCDAVVHLVGDMTGAPAKPLSTESILTKYADLPHRLRPLGEALAKGVDISYTQWEAWLAIYHRKPLLIAPAAVSAPRDPTYAPTNTSRAAQNEHLARLRAMERYPGPTFDSKDQLAKQIAYSKILDLLSEERAAARPRMFPQVSTREVVGVFGVLLLAPLVAEQWAKTLGVALATPLALFLFFGILSLVLVYARYFELLAAGDAPLGSLDRQGYDQLRSNLARGGSAPQLYSRWLTVFLNAVDRFFGDADKAVRTLFPHAFGLRTPAPLWTAPAFDRCLLLALIYPIVTIYILWAVSGHVGPAESALGLPNDSAGWRRGGILAGMGFVVFGVVFFMRTMRTRDRTSPEWGASVLVVMLVATVGGLVAGAYTVAFAVAFAVAGAVAVGVTFAGAFAVAFAFAGAAAVGVVGLRSVAAPVAGPVATAAAFAGLAAVTWLFKLSVRYRWQGVFYFIFVTSMLSACLLVAVGVSSWQEWYLVGPCVLFLGLLTLLNAPFDWGSLGLTRALLRRGLELGGWWPFLLALVDAVLAGIIIALLALTMVLGVQTFDSLAVHGGGKPVLPLRPLFDGIAAHPANPEYWWVYVLLLSTMLPSLFNLVIGSTAVMRGLPGLSSLLLRFWPAGLAVPTYDRAWIAAVLTAQVALGVLLGVAVQGLLAYALLAHAMPATGLALLDICRGLADLDLPARLIRLAAPAS